MLSSKWKAISRRSSRVYTGYCFNATDISPTANEMTTDDDARLVASSHKHKLRRRKDTEAVVDSSC